MSTTTTDAFLPVSKTTNLVSTTSSTRSDISFTSASRSTRLFYDIQRDPPNENVWSILANTERWIASTLKDADEKSGPQGTNPLSRKEVSYVCETSQDPAMILANIFRKLKEARQLGETHGQEQEELAQEQENHNRATLRQTQVLVIPANEDLNDFQVFDQLINAINEARRAARDYITDHSLERIDEKLYGDDNGDDREWVVSVNCAHLHPKFGEKTPEQQLKELQEEEEQGEVDLNLQEYKERRLLARRSPYPSVVVEVRSMAPPEFTPPPPTAPQTPQAVEDFDQDEAPGDGKDKDESVDSEFIQQLEALFSKSSLQNEGGDGFYDSIGSHIETFSSVTPLMVAQNWIDENDPLFDVSKCAFTVSEATHVDEAYEFLFTNLAMQTSQFLESTATQEAGAQKRQYLVMPHFLSNSATSMEKFATQAVNIIRTLPPVRNRIDVSVLHPEHIDPEKRCPVPVFVLQWKD